MTARFESEIKAAADILASARSCVVLTGAGMSTASGIPDFRSPQSGLWSKFDPMEVANLYAFRKNPENFYEWIRPLITITNSAKPNPAHLALADLEKHGPLKAVITQNIDGLHTMAGSKTVYEVHGHMREVRCLDCGVVEDAAPKMADLAENGALPICTHCGGMFKPEVILFGELLPAKIMQLSESAVSSCDVLLVAGSSLEVSPVNQFPFMAKQFGARLIIINFQETHADHVADVVISADVTQILPTLARPFVQNAIG